MTPEVVQLYRDEPDGWRVLSTQQAGETEEFYRFTADSAGLSPFTIATAGPVFEVTDASVTPGGSPLRVNQSSR